MRAWRVKDYGDFREQLTLEGQLPEPLRGPGQALVRVHSVGLNFADLLSIQGRYQVKAPLPFTPGLEASGVVVEADDGGILREGSRVIVALPWGALAETVAADTEACFPVPQGMGHHEAAALLLTYQTSHFALVRRAALRPGEVLLVHNGAGGVGSAAIQLGKALGATVYATAGAPDKLEVCRRSGADHVIDYRSDDFVRAVLEGTGGRGADVIYDSIGGDVFDASTKCIAFEGRLLVIGFAGGRIPSIAANRILLKNISVIGLNWGAYRDRRSPLVREVHDELCAMHAAGSISPVIFDAYPFEDLPRAIEALGSRASFGKLVVDVAAKETPS
ncbi:MAG: NADPH:quinone oxidoreductase family protein [Actinobacteria bacterium]|nr:NADPH:quinone oxidoreductase family protein [Actinomycetota bacterium]